MKKNSRQLRLAGGNEEETHVLFRSPFRAVQGGGAGANLSREKRTFLMHCLGPGSSSYVGI